RLVGQRSGDRLADPPGRVGGELEAPAPVELLDGANQAEVALLDQVEQGEAAAGVALGDRDDESQVGLDERILGRHVVALGAAGKANLVFAREKTDLADFLEIETDAVLGTALWRSNGQAGGDDTAFLEEVVDLGLGGRLLALFFLALLDFSFFFS